MNITKGVIQSVNMKGSDEQKQIRGKSLQTMTSDSATNSSEEKMVENVLILQGGGSLGAFGCGVFKALVQNNVKIDIVAGTSIGGVNAALIAGSKDEHHPEKVLEEFWLELTDNFIEIDRMSRSAYGYLQQMIADYYARTHTEEPTEFGIKRRAEEYR